MLHSRPEGSHPESKNGSHSTTREQKRDPYPDCVDGCCFMTVWCAGNDDDMAWNSDQAGHSVNDEGCVDEYPSRSNGRSMASFCAPLSRCVCLCRDWTRSKAGTNPGHVPPQGSKRQFRELYVAESGRRFGPWRVRDNSTRAPQEKRY